MIGDIGIRGPPDLKWIRPYRLFITLKDKKSPSAEQMSVENASTEANNLYSHS